MKGPDEDADVQLATEIVFAPRRLQLARFSEAEMRLGRTPDFRIFDGENHLGYCELKSPRDDAFDRLLASAAPGEIVELCRSDPVFNRIARHVAKAATQFDAVNPDGALPNIITFVNHDRGSSYADMRETVTGFFFAASGERFATMKHIAEGWIGKAKRKIDLFMWIDAKTRRVQGYIRNEASPHNDLLEKMFDLAGVAKR